LKKILEKHASRTCHGVDGKSVVLPSQKKHATGNECPWLALILPVCSFRVFFILNDSFPNFRLLSVSFKKLKMVLLVDAMLDGLTQMKDTPFG
jgi:hypothetical protein